MSSVDFTQPIVGKIGDFYAWLGDRLSDDAARAEVLIDLGLPPALAPSQPVPQHQIKGINEYRKTISIDTEVSTAAAHDLGKALGLSSSKSAKLILPQKNLANIRAYEKAASPSFDDFKKVLGDVKELFNAVVNFVKALDIEGIHNPAELTHRVLDLLMIDYLRLHLPLVYWLAQPIGFLEEPISQIALPRLAWDRLVSIRNWFPELWVLDNEIQARQFSDRFFLPIAAALVVLGFLSKTKSVDRQDDGDLSSIEIEPHYGWDGAPGSATPLADEISERTLSLRVTWREESPEPPRKIVERHTTVTLLFVPRMDGGPGLLVSFEGGTSADIPLGKHWRLKFDADLTGAADFFIHLNAFFEKSAVIGPAEGSHPSFKVAFERGTAEDPLYRLGKEDGSHLQFGKIGIELELSPELAGVRTFTRESELVLNLDKSNDGFLSRILPGEKKVPLNLGLGFSVQRGFFIEGGKGNVLKQTAPPPPPAPLRIRGARGAAMVDDAADDAAGNPSGVAADLNRVTPVGKSLGPVRIQFLSLGLKPTVGSGRASLTLAATLSADVKLGPVTASLDQTGFAVTADFASPDANLGLFDLDFGFQPPTGIGIDIDAKVVRGGGFLGLDAVGQYSGALHLEIEGIASLSALGLLNTRIPGGGFSLIVIVTADGFKPIPIGFGFMLAGIGGLLGVNRTVNEDAVQSGVRANTLGAVLAPKDLVRNAPQYLSTLGRFFPVAVDHHLFGPVVQLTWGTPTLITINLALIFEFGVRTRFLIMGQLIAILPRKELDLVRLQMNIFGGVDFDQKRAFLDAVLFDSRLVNRFVITGEMRLRMSWGDRPFFALAIGGLHPAFTPPAGMESMPRAAIVFADSADLKIRCDAYWAITSNTVQFGAHAELFAKKSKFSISGHAGYDVLIQFDPFHFIASMSASLQLKAGSKSLFKVSFSGELSGPRPLHVKGKASFEIWWMDFTVSFSTTLVSGGKPPLPAPVDVGGLLRTALADSSSWEAALPGSGERLVSLRENAGGSATATLRIHPLNTVSVKQNVTPLNTVITKFGHTRPAGGPQAFRVLQVTIGTASFEPEVVRDHFAPSQFRDMSDDARLSSPSFELLPAGVAVAAQGAECGVPVSAAADFEDIVVPSPPKTPRATSTMPLAVADRLGEWSAVGTSDLSRLGARRYRAAAIRIPRKEKAFTVTSKVDLVAASPTSTYATRIEAADALGAMDPVRRGTFQLVASMTTGG